LVNFKNQKLGDFQERTKLYRPWEEDNPQGKNHLVMRGTPDIAAILKIFMERTDFWYLIF
jgi:hypothetical protein